MSRFWDTISFIFVWYTRSDFCPEASERTEWSQSVSSLYSLLVSLCRQHTGSFLQTSRTFSNLSCGIKIEAIRFIGCLSSNYLQNRYERKFDNYCHAIVQNLTWLWRWMRFQEKDHKSSFTFYFMHFLFSWRKNSSRTWSLLHWRESSQSDSLTGNSSFESDDPGSLFSLHLFHFYSSFLSTMETIFWTTYVQELREKYTVYTRDSLIDHLQTVGLLLWSLSSLVKFWSLALKVSSMI